MRILDFGKHLQEWRQRSSSSNGSFLFYFTVVFVLLSVLLILGGVHFYHSEIESRYHTQLQKISAITDMKVASIQEMRSRFLVSAGNFAENPFVMDAVSQVVQNPTQDILKDKLMESVWHSSFSDGWLLGLNGELLTSTSKDPVSHTAKQAIADVLAGASPKLCDLPTMEGNHIYLDVVAMIYTKDRKPLAVLVLRMDLNDRLFPLLDFWPGAERTIESLVVMRDKGQALFINKRTIQPGHDFFEREPLTKTHLPAVQAVLGKVGAYYGIDYRGFPVLSYIKPIPSSAWILVVKVDEDDFLADSRKETLLLIVILGGSILLIAFGLNWLHRKLLSGLAKSAEEAKKKLLQFSVVVEENPALILITNRTGAIEYINKKFTEVTGYTQEDVIGKNPRILKSGETSRAEYTRLWKTLQAGETWQGEFHNCKKNGELYWESAMITPIFGDDGKITHFVSVKEDITMRKLDALAIVDANNQYQTILDTMPDLLFEVDQESRIYQYHSHDDTSLLVHPEHFLGKKMLDVLPPEPGAVCFAAIQEAAAKGKSIGGVYCLPLPKGKCWFELSVAALPVQEGRTPHFLLLARDITSRKIAEDELVMKNAEIERFIYTVSHDLKSPLVTIQTFLNYLERDRNAQKEADVVKDMNFIRSAAEKMAARLDGLLELSRVGHQVNKEEKVLLQDIVNEVLVLVAGQITSRKVEVISTQEPLLLYGDKGQFVEVFQNLVDNAVKFLGDQPSPRIEIGAVRVNGDWELFVRDNGSGIDPNHLGKIFGLFHKLEPKSAGSGLGLALVKRIIEVHGGHIQVESEGLGHGVTFRFTLPNIKRQNQ